MRFVDTVNRSRVAEWEGCYDMYEGLTFSTPICPFYYYLWVVMLLFHYLGVHFGG
jgi:hypothetical protein